MKKYMLYLLTFLLYTSCSSEIEDNTSAALPDKFSFLIDIKNDPVRSKATEPGEDALNENKIDRLDVFFYKGESCVFYPENVNYNKTTGRVDVTFTNAQISLFDNTTDYQIIVIANTSVIRSDLSNLTLSQLKQKVQSSDLQTMPNLSFLMDGQVTSKLLYTSSQLPTVKLKRAAVKIRPKFELIDIPGYTFVSANIEMRRFVDKTSLLDGSPYPVNIQTDLKTHAKRGFPVNDTEVFYTYENNWSKESKQEPSLWMEVKLRKDNTDKRYYYKLPLSFLNSNEVDLQYAFRLLRNKIYEFGIQIRELGSDNPENPVNISCNYLIKDWTTKEIEVNINNYHYLVVFETLVNMYNKADYSIGYASSTNIAITDLSVYYTTYNNSGTPTKIPVSSGYTVTIDPATAKIRINSSIPVNYVPREFDFTVTTTGLTNNLTQKVRVVQYPPIYITSLYSSTSSGVGGGQNYGGCNDDYPNGDSQTGQTNFNLYKITILVNDLTKIANINNYPSITNYVIGDPGTITSGVLTTGTDELSNNMISPQFVIASQRGITLQREWTCAFDRCKAYREGPYANGKWRIPTKAEIQIVDMIQDDPNSVVKTLLIGDEYWSARSNVVNNKRTSDSYRFKGNGGNSFYSSSGNFPVRCITDTWK
ncbi:MAG: fimbrial protein [Bacteroidales bacterium]